MSTYVPEPPPGLRDEIAGTVTDLIAARASQPGDDQAGGAPPQSWPAYHLGADALRSGDALSQAMPIGWLSVVHRAGLTALAELDVPGDASPEVRQVSYGDLARGVARLSEAARALDDELGGGAPLEQRLLRVPACLFMGLWLHDDADPSRDVVIPSEPTPPAFEAGRPYPMAEALETLAATVVEAPEP